MFSESTLDHFWDYVAITFLVTVILIITAIEINRRWKEKNPKRAKKVVYGLLVAVIVISASTAVFYTLVEQQGTHFEYEYIATVLDEDKQGVMYIPVCVNEELQERLRVIEGDGTMSIVDTEHGRALRLEFEGEVTVRGQMIKDNRLNDWSWTMQTGSRDFEAWANLELENIENGTVEVRLGLITDIVPGHDGRIYLHDTLKEGWDIYPISTIQE